MTWTHRPNNHQHTCTDCGDIYPSIFAAALCCSPAAYGDDDLPRITRGYN